MSSTPNLDRVLSGFRGNYFHSYDFADLQTDVDDLASLEEEGKFDVKKAETTKKVMQFLSKEIKKNDFFYFEYDWGSKSGGGWEADDFFFDQKKVKFTLDETEMKKFHSIKDKFKGIFKSTLEFNAVIESDKCRDEDAYGDMFIQKTMIKFPYENTIKNNLVVIIDKNDSASGMFSSQSNYIYLKDSSGREWKCGGIPIGPRTLTKSAETIQLLSKKTLSNGDIVVKPLHTKLPSEIIKSILNFIKQGRTELGFCCIDFIELLYGKYEKKLNYCEFDTEKSISPGDVVCLTYVKKTEQDKDLPRFVKNNLSHIMLYLGSKLYLSLFGSVGPLRVASLQTMRQNYQSEDVIVLKT